MKQQIYRRACIIATTVLATAGASQVLAQSTQTARARALRASRRPKPIGSSSASSNAKARRESRRSTAWRRNTRS